MGPELRPETVSVHAGNEPDERPSSDGGRVRDAGRPNVDDPGDPPDDPGSSSTEPATKVDLLFMIDNSISMSDKQEVLRAAVPDLVARLVNPVCVDTEGNQYPAPPEGSTTCPDGPEGQPLTQEFNPIRDINIGIVSSSLGDGGANGSVHLVCSRRPFDEAKASVFQTKCFAQRVPEVVLGEDAEDDVAVVLGRERAVARDAAG